MSIFAHRRNAELRYERREQEAERLKLESIRRLQHAETETKKINELLEEHKGDISFRIFLGTGGDRRMK